MFSRVLTLVFFLICLISCGSKKGTIPVTLKLFQGNLMASSLSNGGVVVVGRSEDGKNSFRTSAANTSSVLSLNLPVGRWEFAAISWEGVSGEPLRGNNRCGYTGFVDLKNSESSVSFDLSMARCKNDFSGNNEFANSSYIDTNGKFLEFFPMLCFDPSLTHTLCPTNVNQSNLLTYKVVFNSEKKGDVQGELNNLSTLCIPVGDELHLGRIPVIDAVIGSPFGSIINFYQSTDCSGVPVVYDFKGGFLNNINVPALNAMDVETNLHSYLNINPGPFFNTLPLNPTSINVVGGNYFGSVVYFNTTNIQFTLGSLPANVAQMCITTQSSCSAGSWVTPQLSGTIVIPSSDGVKTLKVFYKSYAGVVSTTPATVNFTLDTTAPVGYVMTTGAASQANGVTVYWANGSEINFQNITLNVCSDAMCSTPPRATVIVTVPGTSTHTFPTASITSGLTLSEVVYVQMIVQDNAGNFSIISTSPALTTTF